LPSKEKKYKTHYQKRKKETRKEKEKKDAE